MKTLEEIEMCTYFRGVISDKLKTNWLTITIFIIFGLLLAFLEFDFDKESYNTLFSTMATIILALVGFIGIFFVLLLEIKSILENLKEERKKLGKYLNCFKDTFLFAIFSILLFMIPIALNHINFSNDNYSTVFKYRSFFKMFFTGFLFGLFFIILKDSAFILKKTFDKLEFFKLNQDGG